MPLHIPRLNPSYLFTNGNKPTLKSKSILKNYQPAESMPAKNSRENVNSDSTRNEATGENEISNLTSSGGTPRSNTPSAWSESGDSPGGVAAEEVTKFFSRFSWMGRLIFWLFALASLAAIAFGVYYFYQYSKSRDISLSLSAPGSALIGVPFNIDVSFANDSDQPVQAAKMSLTLPEDVVSAENKDKRVISEDEGDISPGSGFKKSIPVIILGNQNSIERFPVSVSYFPPALGPKARLEKTASIDVAVGGPAITLDISSPSKILNGENFQIKVSYGNVSDIQFPDAQIELTLPPSFNLKNANPGATTGNNIWQISNLDKGKSGVITIQGNVLAPEQSFFDIKSAVKIGDSLINAKTASVNIAPSPLALNISINNQSDYISRAGDDLHYVVSYRNNSEASLNDVVIKAHLAGAMFDLNNLRSTGFFSSVDESITWNTANTPELRILAPGAQGTVDFFTRAKQSYPIRRLSDKNFTLKVNAEISSPTVPYYVSADKTVAIASLETKVSGQTVIQSQAFYNDPTNQIKTSGPFPPKVNTPTTFAVLWTIVNYSTDVSNIEIKTTLPSGVRFTSIAKSNINSVPVYNDRTGGISWSIDKIAATKGALGKPVQTAFQIEATPNTNQAGQVMPLLNEAQLTATDNFTSTTLTSSAPALTTQLANDTSVNSNQYSVQP